MTHELKTWPEPFEGVISGNKRHEIRKNDRGFKVGDNLLLREWNPESKKYTGRSTLASVTYITPGGNFGLPKTLCVMTISCRGLLI